MYYPFSNSNPNAMYQHEAFNMQRMMSSATAGSSTSIPTPKRPTTPVPPFSAARASQPAGKCIGGTSGCGRLFGMSLRFWVPKKYQKIVSLQFIICIALLLSVLGGPAGHAIPGRVAASETSSSHEKAEDDESQDTKKKPATKHEVKKRPAADTEHRPLGGTSADDDDEDTSGGTGESGQAGGDDDDETPGDERSKKKPAARTRTAVKKRPAKRKRTQDTHQVIFSLISLSKILVSYNPNSGHRRNRMKLNLWFLVNLWLKLDLRRRVKLLLMVPGWTSFLAT